MHFGFVIDSLDIDLCDIDLLDTDLDLSDTDIPRYHQHFVCLQDVLKTSWRHIFKTYWRHVLKTSWKHVLKTSCRRLQRNHFSSSKACSSRLARRKIVTLKTCWRPTKVAGYFVTTISIFDIINNRLII